MWRLWTVRVVKQQRMMMWRAYRKWWVWEMEMRASLMERDRKLNLIIQIETKFGTAYVNLHHNVFISYSCNCRDGYVCSGWVDSFIQTLHRTHVVWNGCRSVITVPLRSRLNKGTSGYSMSFANWQRMSITWRSISSPTVITDLPVHFDRKLFKMNYSLTMIRKLWTFFSCLQILSFQAVVEMLLHSHIWAQCVEDLGITALCVVSVTSV